MKRYALGLDYGTNSCRCLIVDLSDGREVASCVFDFPSGAAGILLDPREPNLARQNPQDYVAALSVAPRTIRRAKRADRRFDAAQIVGIGIDTTGSTPMPVDRDGTPLAMRPQFKGNLDAMAWLWKDHTGHAEAAEITARARKIRPQYLAKCGGTYSSEWFWSKILRCKRAAPKVFAAAHSFVEHCDWMPALLAGDTRPEKVVRGVCAAGHKAMYCPEWGGLPDEEFLRGLDPALAALRGRLYEKAVPADHAAGRLSAEWAKKLGLKPGIAVAAGAFDAHMGAVGAGIREGTLVKILGTSTCDMMVMPNAKKLADIPGVCGIVDGSILPGFYGIEAGQSAVGDIFLWFVSQLVPERYGRTMDEKFKTLGALAAKQKPGEHGLLALDWNNGNRTILVDVRLSGLLLGQTLHTQAHEIYRALIEATAFGALTISEAHRGIRRAGEGVRQLRRPGGEEPSADADLCQRHRPPDEGLAQRPDLRARRGDLRRRRGRQGGRRIRRRARSAAGRLRREGEILPPEPEGAGGLRRALPALPHAARRLRRPRLVGPARPRDEGPYPHPRTATRRKSEVRMMSNEALGHSSVALPGFLGVRGIHA